MSTADDIAAAARRLPIRPEAVRTYLDAGHGVRGTGVERRFHTTAKPIGAANTWPRRTPKRSCSPGTAASPPWPACPSFAV